jgi:hypothetical protein
MVDAVATRAPRSPPFLEEKTMPTQTTTIVDWNGYPIDDDVVSDGGALRVPIPFMDHLAQEVRRALQDGEALFATSSPPCTGRRYRWLALAWPGGRDLRLNP